MSRRPNSRGWYLSQVQLLVLILIVAAGLYLYFHPDILSGWIGQPGSAPSAELATSTPAPPEPTAAVRATPAPAATSAPRATAAPKATPEASGTDALLSLRGAWYQLYFTRPRYPDRAANHQGGIDARLVAFLNTATKTIDLADYDFDLENAAQALAAAAARGVRVRMVTDTDTLTSPKESIQRAFAILKQANIPVVDDQRPAIMHNKFVVVDDIVVWTGSWNFTVGDTYRLNNNAIKIVSPGLAKNYTLEFEQMFEKRLFGPAKQSTLHDPVLTIGGARVENYFAPEDQVASHIIKRIELAQQSIHFMAFSFTSDTIGRAMRDRAKAGVQISGVFEKNGSETLYSEYGKFLKAKYDVLQDGNPYLMHHKVIIIDGKTVIFGSFNFSNNADKDNDENLLIVDDAGLAQAFEAEFQRVRDTALASDTQNVSPTDPGLDTMEMLTIGR